MTHHQAMPPLALFSQADARNLGNGDLVRMLDSVHAQAWPAAVNVYVVLNHANAETAQELEQAYPFLTLRRCAGMLSLSANRNMLLREFLEHVPNQALVAFPDDDVFYKPGFFAEVVSEMAATGADYLLGIYNDPPVAHHPRFSRGNKPVDAGVILRDCASATIFVKGELARKVGLFDEALGLGTPAMGGEDNDYGLRLYALSQNGVYRPHIIAGHPVKDANKARYYPAFFHLYQRHRQVMKAALPAYPLVRRFVRGVQFVLTGKLPLRAFVATWYAFVTRR